MVQQQQQEDKMNRSSITKKVVVIANTNKNPNSEEGEEQQHPATAATTTDLPQKYIFSSTTSSAASLFLKRRFLLSTLFIPTCILFVPPTILSFVSLVAYLVTTTSTSSSSYHHIHTFFFPETGSTSNILTNLFLSLLVLYPTYCTSTYLQHVLHQHAPNEYARKKALAQSKYALPFWSFVGTIIVIHYGWYIIFSVVVSSDRDNNDDNDDDDEGEVFAQGGGIGSIVMTWGIFLYRMIFTTTLHTYLHIMTQVCIRPTMMWTFVSLVVQSRFETVPLPFVMISGSGEPFVRCSCIPLRTNPTLKTIHHIVRNFTSKTRFLDWIANGLDKLSAPSPSSSCATTTTTTTTNPAAATTTTTTTTPPMPQVYHNGKKNLVGVQTIPAITRGTAASSSTLGQNGVPFTIPATTTTATTTTSSSSSRDHALPKTTSSSYKTASILSHSSSSALQQNPSIHHDNTTIGRSFWKRIFESSVPTRYSQPRLVSLLIQMFVHCVMGGLFARMFILPYFLFESTSSSSSSSSSSTTTTTTMQTTIIILSCALASLLEFLSNVPMSELQYQRYYSTLSSIGGEVRPTSTTTTTTRTTSRYQFIFHALSKDVWDRVRNSRLGLLQIQVLSIFMATTMVWLWSSSISLTNQLESIGISYLAVTIWICVVTIQDVLTRWTICTCGLDIDLLLFQTPSSAPPNHYHHHQQQQQQQQQLNDKSFTLCCDMEVFLVEDLIIQSVLMGDGATVENVIRSGNDIHPSPTSGMFRNLHEEEIRRNELAISSFAQWIDQYSTTTSVGKLSDDILRICILESLGGGGSASQSDQPCQSNHPFYFGENRHILAVRRRLDLSDATASPGRQPIIVPVVRALCAFAGGVGDAMSLFFRNTEDSGKQQLARESNTSSIELWNVPPASLKAVEFSILAAARLVVMNSTTNTTSSSANNVDSLGRTVVVNPSKRNHPLSLLLPCILQSAYTLRCGIHQYAKALVRANEINLSKYDTKEEVTDDSLGNYIAAECPDLCIVLSACNDAAAMVLKTIVELDNHMMEEVLLHRKWKGDMQQWLANLKKY